MAKFISDEEYERFLDEQMRLKFDWDELNASRYDVSLQEAYPVSEGKSLYMAEARACPHCFEPPETLTWFYHKSFSEWERGPGVTGWVTVCDNCKEQVDFFTEVFIN
jgi:hypothetical protein